MQHLIKDGQIIKDDPWQLFESTDAQGLPGNALLPVRIWTDFGHELAESSLPFGAYVCEDDDYTELLPFLANLQIIAFKFSKFADGRMFTFARLLRMQHKFKGEIRAIGDFLPDQINYLQRCGFNAFSCRTENEMQTALSIKDHFTEQYQSDTRLIEPLFRRRTA